MVNLGKKEVLHLKDTEKSKEVDHENDEKEELALLTGGAADRGIIIDKAEHKARAPKAQRAKASRKIVSLDVERLMTHRRWTRTPSPSTRH